MARCRLFIPLSRRIRESSWLDLGSMQIKHSNALSQAISQCSLSPIIDFVCARVCVCDKFKLMLNLLWALPLPIIANDSIDEHGWFDYKSKCGNRYHMIYLQSEENRRQTPKSSGKSSFWIIQWYVNGEWKCHCMQIKLKNVAMRVRRAIKYVTLGPFETFNDGYTFCVAAYWRLWFLPFLTNFPWWNGRLNRSSVCVFLFHS